MIVLVRIDDRLLHGQVSMGWQPTLEAAHVVVADDRAAADAWEREVYEASGPEGADVSVIGLADAIEAWATWTSDSRRTLVLVRTPADAAHLVEGVSAAGQRFPAAINVGGCHDAPDRRDAGFGFSLSPDDIDALSRLETRDVRCTFQALPTDPPRRLGEFVGEAR